MIVYDFDCFADFIFALGLSFLIGVLFDLVRSIRFKNKKISDFVFSVFAFLTIGYVWIYYLDGNVRWYVIFTLFAGFLIYFFVLSNFVYPCLFYVAEKIKKFCHFIFKILLTLLHFLGKIGVYVGRMFSMRKLKRKKI